MRDGCLLGLLSWTGRERETARFLFSKTSKWLLFGLVRISSRRSHVHTTQDVGQSTSNPPVKSTRGFAALPSAKTKPFFPSAVRRQHDNSKLSLGEGAGLVENTVSFQSSNFDFKSVTHSYVG